MITLHTDLKELNWKQRLVAIPALLILFPLALILSGCMTILVFLAEMADTLTDYLE